MSEEDILEGPNVGVKNSGNLAQKHKKMENTALKAQERIKKTITAEYRGVAGLTNATSLETNKNTHDINMNEEQTKARKNDKTEVEQRKIENIKHEEKKEEDKSKVEQRKIENIKHEEKKEEDKTEVFELKNANEKFRKESEHLLTLIYSGTNEESKRAQEALNRIAEILKQEKISREDMIEVNKNIMILRNIDTSKLSEEDRETHNKVLQETENVYNKITSEFFGVDYSRIENDITSRALNYIINSMMLKRQLDEKSYEKTAEELLTVMENMKEYLNNPNKEKDEIEIHENTTINETCITLCTLYFAKAQKDNYIESPDYEDSPYYQEATVIYLDIINDMNITYLNENNEIVTEKGSEFFKDKEMEGGISFSEYTEKMYGIWKHTETSTALA